MARRRRQDSGFAAILALSLPKSLILLAKGSGFSNHALEVAK
jgi:hypothetical protein